MFRFQKQLPKKYLDASDNDLIKAIESAKSKLANTVFILGHHYQRDDIMRFADAAGDSLGLSRKASEQKQAKYIVFCGVYFMAEAADILTREDQSVILPDLNAGCSMADMADLDSVEQAYDELGEIIDIESLIPITYMNSSAALKAFVGAHGGSVCTSSNAKAVVTWALSKGKQILFFPDQHLGRNTAFQLGFNESDIVVWDPNKPLGSNHEIDIERATFILWKGHCSVHQRFTPEHIQSFRANHPGGVVIVHPECSHETVELADFVGSTDFIIKTVSGLNDDTDIAIGTEIHLVNRLSTSNPNKRIISLDPLVCPCSTMFRIDLKHLAWILEELCLGNVHNVISIDQETSENAAKALSRMLEIV